MQYRVIDKIVDSLIVFMLIMSAGGMLFVLNRNIASVVFLLFILFVLIFMENNKFYIAYFFYISCSRQY
jgi:hypothetical protein